MSFPTNLNSEKLLAQIESAIHVFFAKMKSQGVALNTDMSAYHFSTGGKRLRALIPSILYASFGKPPQAAIPLGISLELIHNATLVHDDLQDGDTLRRGQPTVWKKYSDVQAINCGDALYQYSTLALDELDVPSAIWKKISSRLALGTLRVIEGQAQEFLMKDEEAPTWNRYYAVVAGKTAALISTAVVCSLQALEVDDATIASAEIAALNSGILFQIQDDLLDVYGDKQRETRATDVAEGKISALVSICNERADAKDRATLARILKTPREQTTQAMIQEALELFQKYDVQNILIGKIKTIQSSLDDDSNLKKFPDLQNFFLELNDLFLKPIRHLISVERPKHGNQF